MMEIEPFIKEAQGLMASAGFNLRGWINGSEAQTVENVLGLQWYCKWDELG